MRTSVILVLCSLAALSLSTGVFVEKEQASTVMRQKRAGTTPKPLSPEQLESLKEVCKLDMACDEMATNKGIVAAYVAHYGPVPF